MYRSINPFSGEDYGSFDCLNQEELQSKLALSYKVYEDWKQTSFYDRSQLLNNVTQLLIRDADVYATSYPK